MTSPIFIYILTVPQSAIDDYGHVNNVIYVQWMQDAAIRHGEATLEYKLPAGTGWFAREHRIEYIAPAYLGEQLEVRTWLSSTKLSRIQRRYEFVRVADGKVIAKGETLWIYVSLSNGRPIPIPEGILALFPILSDPTPPAS